MPKGAVTLVGAGPGDPGLLTRAGRDALLDADVVLHDRLVGDGILAMIPAETVLIDVGKNRGNHPIPQDEITALLLRHAQTGKRVVRLKGGDPYLFGRGGEEADALHRAGIPFQVIPGVSSAIAAPAAAGIPVTHRGLASSVHIVSGHGQGGQDPDIRYTALVEAGGTLVFLMGLSPLRTICAGLVAAGMAPETPAALVENGTRPNQRSLVATVATIADAAAGHDIVSPSVLVVGQVCELAETDDCRPELPLRGVPVLAVSSAVVGGRLAGRLRAAGCEVDEFAGIRMEPLTLAAGWHSAVTTADWIILTSPYGADLFFSSLLEAGIDIRALARCKFAVVGDRTAERVKARGIVPDCMPPVFSGERLAQVVVDVMQPGERAALFQAEDGNPETAALLRRHGFDVDVIAAYRTVPQPFPAMVARRLRDNHYAAVTVTSSSAVQALARGSDSALAGRLAICIGDLTADAARRAGMQAVTAPAATLDAMVDTLIQQIGPQ